MTHEKPGSFVLSLYPTSRGFAYVFFEGPDAPFDWGEKRVKEKHKNTKTLGEIKKLIDRYRPEALVIENTTGKQSRRTARIRKLYRMIVHLAAAEYIDLYRYSWDDVRACFASVGAVTKHETAQAIATQIPAFAHRIPPFRKQWMSEDPRQSLFDAVALALFHYQQTCRSQEDSSTEI